MADPAPIEPDPGQSEVHVRPFPNVTESEWQVSRDGGMDPAWRRDDRKLFYRRSFIMMEVPVTVETTFTSGNTELFRTDTAAGQALAFTNTVFGYDILPDGRRLLMVMNAEPTNDTPQLSQLVVVLNWAEAPGRAPTE